MQQQRGRLIYESDACRALLRLEGQQKWPCNHQDRETQPNNRSPKSTRARYTCNAALETEAPIDRHLRLVVPGISQGFDSSRKPKAMSLASKPRGRSLYTTGIDPCEQPSMKHSHPVTSRAHISTAMVPVRWVPCAVGIRANAMK